MRICYKIKIIRQDNKQLCHFCLYVKTKLKDLYFFKVDRGEEIKMNKRNRIQQLQILQLIKLLKDKIILVYLNIYLKGINNPSYLQLTL